MIITTPRLILRPANHADFAATYKLLSDPEVMHFSLNGPYSQQKTTDFINHCLRQREQNLPGLLAVISKTDDVLIGYCGFYLQKINGIDEVELGYRLLKAYRGKGLATEAATAMKKHAFEEFGLTRLISIIDKKNTASARVAEKVGLTLEKEMLYNNRIQISIYATPPEDDTNNN